MKKEAALKIICDCAQTYHEVLEGRNLLFVCAGPNGQISTLEIVFTGSNFLHMTGVKFRTVPRLSASEFYSRCLHHRLRPSDFDLDPLGYTELKLAVLPSLLKPNLGANMVGDYNGSHPLLVTDKLAGNVKCCLGLVTDPQKQPFYAPNSVLNLNIKDVTHDTRRILATYRKTIAEAQYSELIYKAKKVRWEDVQLPEAFAYLELPQE